MEDNEKEEISINKTIMVGTINRNPVISTTIEKKKDVANFSIKTYDSFIDSNGEKKVKEEYHRVAVWGKEGVEKCKEFKIGDRLYIEGKIRTRRLVTQENERPIFITEIIATDFKKVI